MLPAPPGLFSTYTDCPSDSDSRAATARAMISLEPPGANGTTKRIVRDGQADWAWVGRGISRDSRQQTANSQDRRRVDIGITGFKRWNSLIWR